MPSTATSFSDLIAPLAPADISAFWHDRTLKLTRCTGESRFTVLFNWNTLWQLIDENNIPLQKFRVTYNRQLVRRPFYSDGDRLNSDRLAQLFDQGISMVVLNVDTHVPAIFAACRDAATYGIRIDEACAIVTTGSGGALKMHYDLPDLIVLQVEGSKRWRIYGPRVLNRDKGSVTKDPPRTAPLLDAVLQPGDILFMPAGSWHLCDNGPNRSLHLALFVKPPEERPGVTLERRADE